jgi:hypothetical protein
VRLGAPLLLALLALGACEGKAPAPDVVAPPPTPAAAAVVDGEVILRRTIEEQVAMRTEGRTLTAQERQRLLRAALETQIKATLVEAALREAGLEPTDGLEVLLDQLEPLRFDPAAVERIYRLEHGDITPPQEARFTMILLRLPPDAGATKEDRVRKDLLRVLRRIEGDMTFEEAAKEYSQDPSRELEGQWEFVDLRRLEPQLRAAVAAAPVGKIIGPVRTAEGWALLRVDGRRVEMDTAVGSRKAAIHRRLLMGLAAERREKFLKRLRQEATVEVAEDLR